jgi:hypothetical protein
MSQKEMSTFWEVMVSVILSKKCICTCVLFRTFSEIELFHCTWVWIWRPILSFTPVKLRPVRMFPCGWMKSEVHRIKLNTRDELLDIIMDVIASIKKRQDALRPTTRHVVTRVAKSIDVYGGIFENILYQVKCTKFVIWTINTDIRNNA